MEIPNANTYDTFKDIEDEKVDIEEKESQLSLLERINLAIKDARPIMEANREDEKMALLVNDFISGQISLNEFNKINEIESEISKPGTVEFVSLEEMCHSLKELLGDEGIAEELTEHEREHFNKVVEVGWMAKILCRFFKDKNNEISLRPGILPDIPKIGNEDEIRNKLKTIIEAPSDQSDIDKMSTQSH